MRIVYFTHALSSCWNHGNAHFQRGLLRELRALGHDVLACEPQLSWSKMHLMAEEGEKHIHGFHAAFAGLPLATYPEDFDPEPVLDGADLVLVHEWTEPRLAVAIGRIRRCGGKFTLLFHDTHHRAVSDRTAVSKFGLENYDGVLAFGRSLAEVYDRAGWRGRTYVFHEAADTRLFKPPQDSEAIARSGAVWIGNWGDGERAEELARYLLQPMQELSIPLDVYGVRYPPGALAALRQHGARFQGYIANMDVPHTFQRYLMTVHVPRRYYTSLLPGIPTIRVFEALASGIPLVSAPWDDSENLFSPGRDFLMAKDAVEMRKHIAQLAADAELRSQLVESGLSRILARHTCRHRAEELLSIARSLECGVKGAA